MVTTLSELARGDAGNSYPCAAAECPTRKSDEKTKVLGERGESTLKGENGEENRRGSVIRPT